MPARWILLVEDNEDDVVLMRRAMQKQGISIHVVTAQDGAEALDILLRSTNCPGDDFLPEPDLVLLDINLPKLSGLEVLKNIRGHESTRLLRVVMFTTSGQQVDLERSYAAGANSYVRKPVCTSSFQRVVHSIGKYWLDLNLPPLTRAA